MIGTVSGRLLGLLIVCLALKYCLSVPITDFFVLGEGSFTTLGTSENAGCDSGFTDFTVCGEILNRIAMCEFSNCTFMHALID